MVRLLNLGCGSLFSKDPQWINIDFDSVRKGVISHNLLKGIPLSDNSVDVVYHSHLLEHFSRSDGAHFIKECFRVLKRGGIIRIVVPDLENICRTYLDVLERALAEDVKSKDKYNWIMLEMYDQAVRTEPGGEMAKYLSQPDLPNKDFIIRRIGSVVRNAVNPDNALQSKTEINNSMSFCKRLMHKALGIKPKGELHKWMYDRYALRRLLEQTGFTDIRQCSAVESRIQDWNGYFIDINREGFVHAPSSLYMDGVKHR